MKTGAQKCVTQRVRGYIPDRKGFADGALETPGAQCTPGSGEALVEAATRLLVEAFHRNQNEISF